ncbi:putative DNA-binding transcriptional regulator AlpA [Streptomyces filamentosus]
MSNTPPATHVGVTEIGEMLSVSRQRANRLVAKADFPAPIAQTKAGRVWERAAVEKWAEGWDRTNVGGRPPKKPPAPQP